jgi:hypothetical protein
MSDLRPGSHDTYGCFPVRGSVMPDHATVLGGTVKVLRVKSFPDIGEENFTGVSRGLSFPCSTFSY